MKKLIHPFDLKKQQRRMLIMEQDYLLLSLYHAMNENDEELVNELKKELFAIHDELKKL